MRKRSKANISISIIIPAYNAESTIDRAVLSVLNQSAEENILEVIVVNDGSNDQTERVVRDILKSHPKASKIKYISTKNAGVSSARNTGIKSSKGNWIALLDSDDYWTVEKLSKQIGAILVHDDIRFIGANSQKDIINHGKKIGGGLRKITFMQYMLKSSPSTCSIMFEKSLTSTTGLFDLKQSYAEDSNLFMRMIHDAGGGYYFEDVLLMLDDKPTFGSSGLSSNLKAMHEGCLKNIKDAYELRYITLPSVIILYSWEYIRYIRRILKTKYRQAGKLND